MRTHVILVPLLLSSAIACSSGAAPSKPAPVEHRATATTTEPATEPATAPAPADQETHAARQDGMAEVHPYDETPGGRTRFAALVVARDEKLLGFGVQVFSWMPGASNGGAGDDQIDVALIEKRGAAALVFQTVGGRRQTLPVAIPLDDLEGDQWMVEERADKMILARVSAITAFDTEGDTEAFLLAWDDKARAPVKVKHWKGTHPMPAWAIPQE
jgi:hypothetical protein